MSVPRLVAMQDDSARDRQRPPLITVEMVNDTIQGASVRWKERAHGHTAKHARHVTGSDVRST